MSEQKPAGFEAKLERIEQIVKDLESGKVDLDRSIVLFKEGKSLEAECDAILRGAQQEIDRAMGGAKDEPPL